MKGSRFESGRRLREVAANRPLFVFRGRGPATTTHPRQLTHQVTQRCQLDNSPSIRARKGERPVVECPPAAGPHGRSLEASPPRRCNRPSWARATGSSARSRLMVAAIPDSHDQALAFREAHGSRRGAGGRLSSMTSSLPPSGRAEGAFPRAPWRSARPYRRPARRHVVIGQLPAQPRPASWPGGERRPIRTVVSRCATYRRAPIIC